jgi:hypothetical protein
MAVIKIIGQLPKDNSHPLADSKIPDTTAEPNMEAKKSHRSS